MVFTLGARNFKVLREFAWSPSGVSVLVGANGSGKTTALRLLEALRRAYDNSFPLGLSVFGLGPIRHLDAASDDPCTLSVTVGDLTWTIVPDRTTVYVEEHVRDAAGIELLFRGRGEPDIVIEGLRVSSVGGTALRSVADPRIRTSITDRVEPLGHLVQGSRYYARYRLAVLIDEGSPQSRDVRLDTDGRNLFAVLRNWRDLSEHEHRWEYVRVSMKELFPWLRRLDFDSVANRVSAMAVHEHWKKEKLGPDEWPDGFFNVLLDLTALASADPGGVVAIDEPETSLHPALIRALIDAMRDWSARQDVTVLLATHSPVVLDCFREAPDQVYVMESGATPLPKALTELKKREWLEHYSLGDLYSQLEVGAP